MIQIPERLRNKLDENQALSAAVRKNLETFTPWIKHSGMPFFPGFTDHGTSHINEVLKTAASLISDASYKLLSAEDVAVLALSILLHDCGMHMTQDAFRALISNDQAPVIPEFRDQPWRKLWQDYLSEARRFGQDKLLAIFGKTDPYDVTRLDLSNLTERDYFLIGEFVRRHHTRFAHEVALRGVPRAEGLPLQLTDLDHDFKDMSGLVARSHGMSIRSTAEYITQKYGLFAEYKNVKLPFLMAVLRISDYVQVKSERALQTLLSVKELRSPVSRQEWRNHAAVQDVSLRHNDPEALYVQAIPVDVITYLRLEALLRDIQRELDESWATLGEVYGRLNDLSKLGLLIRRVRSNLDSKDKFSRNVSYLPIKARFDSSGPDLLKLLVGPLYNYEYKVGIRELLQNAVDACKELIDLKRTTPSIVDDGNSQPSVKVLITENEDGTGWIEVSDNGIGMAVDTVTQYFLIAGASFRNSDVWKKQHTDEAGQVKVTRGGRFGVGALAAFLLGDEITVTTRHINQPAAEGIEFKARIDAPTIELRRYTGPNGTSIKIWVSDTSVLEELKPYTWRQEINAGETVVLTAWDSVDWFVQATPKVEYRWDGYTRESDSSRVRYIGTFTPRKEHLVPTTNSLDDCWHAIPNPDDYEAIYWRYIEELENIQRPENDEFNTTDLGHDEITVNGIRIKKATYYDSNSNLLADIGGKTGPDINICRPTMAIFDPAGLCPINLQRSSIAFERMGVDEILAKDILRHRLVEMSTIFATGCSTLGEFTNKCRDAITLPGILYTGQIAPFCITKKGISLLTPRILDALKVKSLLFIDSSDKNCPLDIPALLSRDEALLVRLSSGGIQADLAWFRGIFAQYDINYYQWSHQRSAGFPKVERVNAISAIPLNRWESANQKGKVRRSILSSLNVSDFGAGHVIVESNHKNDIHIHQRIRDVIGSLNSNAEVAVWQLASKSSHEEMSLIEQVWMEVFKTHTIPLK